CRAAYSTALFIIVNLNFSFNFKLLIQLNTTNYSRFRSSLAGRAFYRFGNECQPIIVKFLIILENPLRLLTACTTCWFIHQKYDLG
ncbi:MAG: hypothetical protein Q7S87_19610, partial [Agitococcus sp.]|nr:hypothetical protein [Agitococcus sp.]